MYYLYTWRLIRRRQERSLRSRQGGVNSKINVPQVCPPIYKGVLASSPQRQVIQDAHKGYVISRIFKKPVSELPYAPAPITKRQPHPNPFSCRFVDLFDNRQNPKKPLLFRPSHPFKTV
ncbi:uncharacterized protein A4U43_C07F21870 [Asparagus officinalis]|uniref:Uncharacterized protein n=1 Tax=Asparagus officinalis TaxID=4686 RepID=A0A5P1EGY2_ASPOF|nr:uncharacterized protein A4U43_C07F21870 [Asparagus officinalis]